ncbi:MAG: sigma-70 family RNA polymerase sigma factor [Planctomycetes bacterium]|nr:sigma-70 family RNA polymerase sigma factor [Planctomycetota bacterium]
MRPEPPTSRTIEHLLQHRAWLERLVRALVRDDHVAADVLQETWTAAVERPPRTERTSQERAWLAGVARNWARRIARNDTRRRQREERAAQRGSDPASVETLERMDVQRRILEATLTLEEPYREVMALRYFEELSPGVIARRLEKPVRTIHSQLHRGLAKLRVALEGEFGSRESRERAYALILGSSQLSTAGTVLAGGMLMTTKTWLALLTLIATAGCLWVFAFREERANDLPRTLDEDPSRSAFHPGSPTGMDPAGRERRDVIASRSQPIETAELPVTVVVLAASGEPVAGFALQRTADQEHLGSTDERGQLVIPWERLGQGTSTNHSFFGGSPIVPAAAVLGPTFLEPNSPPTPGGRYTLRLPPTGSVQIHLVRPPRMPADEPVRVTVAPEVPFSPLGAQATSSGHTTTDDVIEFSHVAVGTTLRIRSASPEGRFYAVDQSIQGPSRPAESVSITLRVGRYFPRLCGRVVGSDGRVLPGTHVSLHLVEDDGLLAWDDSEPIPGDAITTDAEGRFAHLVDRKLPDDIRYVAHFTIAGADDVPFAGHGVSRTIEGTALEGHVELGDLIVGDDPVLVRGRVVDEHGRPIPSAWVRFVALGQWNRHPWAGRAVPWMDQRVDPEDGTFVLRSKVLWDEARIEVRDRAGQRPMVQQTVTVPAHDVHLVMPSGGIVRGSVRVAEHVPADQINVRLTVDSTPRQAQLGADATFELGPVPSGLYEVSFLVHGIEFLRLHGVTVHADARDPALQDIDLRELLRSFRLRSLDPRDHPLEAGLHFHVTNPGSSLEHGLTTTRFDGRADLALPATVHEVVAWMEGRRAERVTWSPDIVDVRFRDPLEILLLPSNAKELERTGTQLVLKPLLDPPLDRNPPLYFATWDPTLQGARVFVPAPGRYRVLQAHHRDRPDGGETTIREQGDEAIVTILESPDPQRVTW